MTKNHVSEGQDHPDRRYFHTGWLESHRPKTSVEIAEERRALLGSDAPAAAPREVATTVRADESGQLRLSPAQRERWGMTPDAEFLVEETPDGLILRRADPALAKVIVEPTSRCNLNCRTCVRHSWDEPLGSMSWPTYESLLGGLRQVPTLRTIAFWGIGEPLYHPDIAEMVRTAHDLGVRTELITNALLLDREKSEALILAGLDKLVVSVDGASDEAQADVRSGASLEQVRRNVRGLHAVREKLLRDNPEIAIEFVAMRRNLHELPSLRRLAYELEARSIIITGVLPYTPELAEETLYGYKAGTIGGTRASWEPEIVLPLMDTRQEVLEPVVRLLEHTSTLSRAMKGRRGASGYCRFVAEGTAAVTWTGDVSPCVGLMHSYSAYVHGLERRITRYDLGNVAEEAIGRIWESGEYRDFRKRVLDFDFAPCTDCGGCELATANESDCFGNEFPVCGGCLWAKGVIQCP